MKLKKYSFVTYAIEEITEDELEALRNAIIHTPLDYARELHGLLEAIKSAKKS